MKKILLGVLAAMSLATSTHAQTVPNYVPTNGLVGWWPFNGNAIDESINTNDGTVNGATLTTDRFGNANSAYSFDGVNDFIDLGLNQQINNLDKFYTFSFFIMKNDLNSTMVFANVDSTIVGNGWRLLLRTTSVFESSFRNSANWYSCTSIPNSIIQNNWIHIVTTRENSIIKTYINGQLNSTSNVGTLSPNNCPNAKSKIGKHWVNIANNYEFINGKLDDFGVWNRALTQQEITGLYNANICYDHVTVTDTLVINTNITGFNPVTYQNTIKVFPNPSNDHITIHYGNYANLSGYQLKITNSLGQQMFQTAITQQSSFVDLKTWTGNGIYFVHIIDAQGNTIDIKKIVLQ